MLHRKFVPRDLDHLNTYLERQLVAIEKKSNGAAVAKKLHALIVIIKNATFPEFPTSLEPFTRFLISVSKIENLSKEVGEDKRRVHQELKRARRIAQSWFTRRLNWISSRADSDSIIEDPNLVEIRKLPPKNRTFYYRSLAAWIAKKHIPLERLALSLGEIKRLAPHLTYLRFVPGLIGVDYDDKTIGDILRRTKRLRHLKIKGSNMTGVAFSQFENTSRLKTFVVKKCPNFNKKLPQGMRALQKIRIEGCNKFNRKLPKDLTALKTLTFWGCHEFNGTLPAGMNKLRKLTIQGCPRYNSPLPLDLTSLRKLRTFYDYYLYSRDARGGAVTFSSAKYPPNRFEFLEPIYLNHRQRALRFADCLQLSELKILDHLFRREDPLPAEEMQSLIKRIPYEESLALLKEMTEEGGRSVKDKGNLNHLLKYPSKMVVELLKTPAGKDFVERKLFDFLENPKVQPLLFAAYPAELPENASFYPLEIKQLHDVLYLTITPSMARDRPHKVINTLTQMKFRKISVAYLGSEVIDEGGPKKQFFADLMMGLIQSPAPYKFEKSNSGKLFPVGYEDWVENSMTYFTLGKFLGLALRARCPIGDVFCKEFIHCLRSFSNEQLDEVFAKLIAGEPFGSKESHADFVAYMKDCTPPSPLMDFVERVLVSKDEEDAVAAAKELNNLWFDDDLAAAIDKRDLNSIQGIVRNIWLDGYEHYFKAAYSIARGMRSCLPFKILDNVGKKHIVNSWDDLAYLTTEDIAMQLQGKLTINWIKDNLVFEPKLSEEAQNVQKWINQWFDDNEGKDEGIANVIQTLTGSRSITQKVTFYLTASVKGFDVHTCDQMVFVPMEIDEEGIRAVLDAYGRGEHLQFNKR